MKLNFRLEAQLPTVPPIKAITIESGNTNAKKGVNLSFAPPPVSTPTSTTKNYIKSDRLSLLYHPVSFAPERTWLKLRPALAPARRRSGEEAKEKACCLVPPTPTLGSIPGLLELHSGRVKHDSSLRSLLAASEKAACIAQLCRQEETLFSLLIEEKRGADKNKKFLQDFKTLADVLIQEVIKHDVGKEFPELQDHICGEESNKFENSLDSTNQYIRGCGNVMPVNGIYPSGLHSALVLIGVYNRHSGEPVLGIINEPFFQEELTAH
ncbi:hypothetical protein E2320_016132, partial [Naja naja]